VPGPTSGTSSLGRIIFRPPFAPKMHILTKMCKTGVFATPPSHHHHPPADASTWDNGGERAIDERGTLQMGRTRVGGGGGSQAELRVFFGLLVGTSILFIGIHTLKCNARLRWPLPTNDDGPEEMVGTNGFFFDCWWALFGNRAAGK